MLGALTVAMMSWLGASCGSLVVVSPDDLLRMAGQLPPAAPQMYMTVLPKPDIYWLHIRSFIKYRYARTEVTSKVANPANVSQQVNFNFLLPETAFITSFHLEIDGKKYKAYVKEKDLARREYEEAVENGLSAAHVRLSARDYNKFSISVNVEALGKVQFVLTYEQLLSRIVGLYNHVIHLNPGQIVRDMEVEVHIVESSTITRLQVPEIRSASEMTDDERENPFAEIKLLSEREVNIRYRPTVQQQAHFLQHLNEMEKESFVVQLVVKYDVDRESGGQVLLKDGYFVHFFSPKDLAPLPKLAVFVLDVSGSMEGRKLEQLKEAMSTILDDLGPKDYFNIIEFSYSVTVHNLDTATGSIVLAPDVALNMDEDKDRVPPQAYPATDYYIDRAKMVIRKMSSGGGTNIHDALKNSLIVAKSGLQELLRMKETNSSHSLLSPSDTIEPIIIFLTDGDPTVGITNSRKILSMVKELNNRSSCAIFSLGFGDGADLNFLRKLSLAHAGFARNIYEASDAALQLNNFYKEIASPLLSNVTFTYTSGQVNDVTRNRFQTLFLGSELVVAGRTKDRNANCTIKAITANGTREFHTLGWRDVPDNVTDIVYLEEDDVFEREELRRQKKKKISTTERLWAYLSVKQLLDQYELANENADERNALQDIRKQVLKLALKYKFVTTLTSLVVVKPNQTTEIDADSLKPYSPDGPLQSFLPVADLGPKEIVERIDTIDDVPFSVLSIQDVGWLNPLYMSDNVSIELPINDHNDTKQYLILLNPTNTSYQECSLNDTSANCEHFVNCILPEFAQTLEEYLPYFCAINERYAGVCCLNSLGSSEEYNSTTVATTSYPELTTMISQEVS